MNVINLKHFVKTWCISAIGTISNENINSKTLLLLREYIMLLQHCESEVDFRPDYIPRWVLEEMLKDACYDPKKHLDVIIEIIGLLSSRGE